MAVTIDDIAVELGRTTPTEGSIEAKQWGSWIGRAEGAIRRRAERFGVDPASLDPETFDEVVTYIVARLARTPQDGAEQVTESAGVDDYSHSETRRYRTGYGDVWVLDEWWDMLGLAEPVFESWSGSIGYTR